MEIDTPTGIYQRLRAIGGRIRGGDAISVARRFLVTYAILLGFATAAIGIWVGQQIEDGVLNRTAAVTALYIHSLVAPEVQSLAGSDHLAPQDVGTLGNLLANTEIGQRLVAFRIWSRDGTVLYSPIPGLTGQRFALAGERALSFQGEVTVDISDLSDPENVNERQRYRRLLEMYVPILKNGSGQVLAVAEFYQAPDEIDAEVANARLRSWIAVLLAAAASFVVVAFMVLRASRTIAQQQARLRDHVTELSRLLSEVADLNQRIRAAGSHAVAISASEQRRISSDLHDGPGQALALALQQFEDLSAAAAASGATSAGEKLTAAHAALTDALTDLRQIAAGLRLPELEPLPLPGVIERAIRDHERRSGTSVTRRIAPLPADAPIAVKIAAFRALQETLSNATRHGRGADIEVSASSDGHSLEIEVSDRGPGFDVSDAIPSTRLGLVGLRERTALVGGAFSIVSAPGRGTTVSLVWPLGDSPAEHGHTQPAEAEA